MSTNTSLSLKSQILHFFGCLNEAFNTSQKETVISFLSKSFNEGSVKLQIDSLIKDRSLNSDFTAVNKNESVHWEYACSHKILPKVRECLDLIDFPQSNIYRDIALALLDRDEKAAEKLIRESCKQSRSKPNELILRIFSKNISIEILNALPDKYSIFLARTKFYSACFNPDINEELSWLSQYDSAKEENALSNYFLNSQTSESEEKISQALLAWSKKDFVGVCQKLSFVLSLISRNKIKKSRWCEYLILIHLFCIHRSGSKKEYNEALLIYKPFLGDSVFSKMLEIYGDICFENFKKAGKKLDSLQFFHKNFNSDTFFILVCRFWCEGALSQKDLLKVKKLMEVYRNSENKLMEYEVTSLYKEVIGAGNLMESKSRFNHIPLARFLKNDQSIFDLLDEKLAAETFEKRFIWLLQMEAGGTNTEAWVEIEPAIQEKGKSGAWKKPELLPWKEISNSDIRKLLSVNDRKVVSLLKNTKDSLGVDYSLPENQALKVLAGSENLFWEEDPSQKIYIDLVSPVLEFYEENNRKLVQWKFPLIPGALHIEEVDDFVYEVCVLNKKLYSLKENSLSPVSLNNTEEEFKAFFESLPDELVIEGEELVGGAEGEHQKTRMIARVTPLNKQNYKIQLLCGCQDMTSIPGEGRRVLALKKGTSQIIWERDKEAEVINADELAKSGGLDPHECIIPYEWELSSPEKLLSALETFHNSPNIQLEWPRGRKINVKSSKSAKLSINSTGKRDWFRLEGDVVFDKKSVKISELLKSIKGNSRFVEVSKNEYLALSKEIIDGLQSINSLIDQRDECLELHAALADTLSTKLSGLPIDVEEDFIFRDCVTRMVYGRGKVVQKPDDVKAELRPYQFTGFEWMTRMVRQRIGVCLADDMGLGKTLQTLCVLASSESDKPSLVIAPTSLCYNWIFEAGKFTPNLELVDYRGSERLDLLKCLKPGALFITSYGLILQDIDFLKEVDWNLVILDEAQMVKNAGTLRSKSIKLLQCESKIALTGTPVENHVGELWNLFDWLNPGLLGSRSYFQDNYALPIEKNIPGKLQSLKEKVKPFILRRLKKNVLKELPDSQETVVFVNLNQQEKEIYDGNKYLVSKKLNLSKKEKKLGKNKIQILAELTRLRRFTSNFELAELYEGLSSKSEAVLNKVEELIENEHNALLFSQFTSHLDIMEDHFKARGYDYCRLDGTMSAAARKSAVDRFSKGKTPLMLISLKAGGYGLNLTAADFVLHLDPWWNPAVEEQASARAIRIGQKNKVTVLRFITASTIEEEITKLHEHKKDITEDLLKGTSKASQLSIEDLLKLIK